MSIPHGEFVLKYYRDRMNGQDCNQYASKQASSLHEYLAVCADTRIEFHLVIQTYSTFRMVSIGLIVFTR